MPVQVKICGITNLGDARAAIDAGADALGFIFVRSSPRFIEPQDAARIIKEVPPGIVKIGVFVDESASQVRAVAHSVGLDRVQLHGRETPELCVELAAEQPIKAFRVKDASVLNELPRYPKCAFLLDSYVPGQHGGTGAKFNWDIAVQAKAFGAPIFLAGGLTPENVADAVAKVGPYALDVSSGVEISPGRKDHEKVRAFIARAKNG